MQIVLNEKHTDLDGESPYTTVNTAEVIIQDGLVYVSDKLFKKTFKFSEINCIITTAYVISFELKGDLTP